jgi:dTDP-4-dehydrorhamnose reductase
MRVLVTGVTGQLGSALVKILGRHDSIIAPRRDELDLAQPARIAAVLNCLAPDLIINPAAYTAVDRAEGEKELAFRVNAEAPLAIASWAAAHETPIIHFSTDYVFDGAGTRPWREDDPTKPLSVYGASKLAGEEAVRSAGGPHLIIRTSWIYAAHGTNFLRTIARLASERKELRIVADQYGAPTPARLIADTVAIIVQKSPGRLIDRFAAVDGLVNVAAAGETTWHGFTVAIVTGLKSRGCTLLVEDIRPIGTDQYPTKAKRPANSRFDLTRLREIFGVVTPDWFVGLDGELDELADEISCSRKKCG